MLIDLIIKLLKGASKGFSIKKVGVNGKKKQLVSGNIKLDNLTSIEIVCEYKDGETPHKLEATHKKGDANDVVKLDGKAKSNVKITHKSVQNVETPVKTIVQYVEDGVTHSTWLYWRP